MEKKIEPLGRGQALKAIAAASAAGAMMVAGTGVAESVGTIPKASAKYQSHPSGANMCVKCRYFIKSNNTCKLVAGPILATGWCTLFAPLPH